MKHEHNFKIIQATTAGFKEVCNECKCVRTTKTTKDGRYDHKQYLIAHVRDTCQPEGVTSKIFNRYYKK